MAEYSSLEVGEHIEIAEWFDCGPLKGTVVSRGTAGFGLKLDTPIRSPDGKRKIDLIFPSFEATSYVRID